MESDQNKNPINHFLINISHVTVKFESTILNHATTKSHVKSLSETGRNRRDLSLVMNDRDKGFFKNDLPNLDRFMPNKNSLLDEETA